jgi:DNA-directed RNA polymerase subunit omega
MIEPSLSSLMKRVDSKYTLVVAAAKRARQLATGAKQLVADESDKPVTVAIHEIEEGKIDYKRKKSGNK